MSRLNLLMVLALACALAACAEFPSEPAVDTGGAVGTANVREIAETGIASFHVAAKSPTEAEFTFQVNGRYDGLYLKRANVNYLAVYPPPFPVITDPSATSVVVGGFVPGEPVGMWEIVPYVDGSPADGRVFLKGALLHPKEAAMRMPAK